VYVLYYSDSYKTLAEVRAFMDTYQKSGEVLAYEYNVDEVEYNNIMHLYWGD